MSLSNAVSLALLCMLVGGAFALAVAIGHWIDFGGQPGAATWWISAAGVAAGSLLGSGILAAQSHARRDPDSTT